MGHYLANCPKLKNKNNEKRKYKEKNKDFKKKYQGRAHVGEEWESDDKDSKEDGMATIAMLKSIRKLFNNISDDEDDTHFLLHGKRVYGTRLVHHPLSFFIHI